MSGLPDVPRGDVTVRETDPTPTLAELSVGDAVVYRYRGTAGLGHWARVEALPPIENPRRPEGPPLADLVHLLRPGGLNVRVPVDRLHTLERSEVDA